MGLGVALTCTTGQERSSRTGTPDAPQASEHPKTPPALANSSEGDAPPAHQPLADPEVEVDSPVAAAPPVKRTPQAVYQSKRTTVIYDKPAWGSPIRGRIDPDHAFNVYAKVPEGIECEGDGWAEADAGGYVCLQRSRPVTHPEPLATLPTLLPRRNTPYIYARPRQDRNHVLEAQVPVYRNKWAYYHEREPIAFLKARHQYAFVELKRSRRGKYLVTEKGRIVPGDHVQIFKPSAYAGRVLADHPIKAGNRAAWSVRRRAEVYDRPSLTKGKIVRRLDYHEQVDIGPQSQRERGEVFEILPGGGRDAADGYVLSADIRHWVPGLVRTDVGADEVWIDVDVGQQVLAIMVGETTEFITLISSGSHKHPTPPGLYRVRYKLAYGKMQSRDEVDEDEVYYVEAVPWVQYFHNRYALHAAFWHNSFGRRRSHGCINLAPADAARVFERTAPGLAPAFTSIHERPRELGTDVRIRKGSEPVEDRRRELSTPVDDEQDVDPASEAGEADVQAPTESAPE